jgi:hypothetical protein
VDPTECAQKLAAWVKANDVNGVDIDYEDEGAFAMGLAEKWIISKQRLGGSVSPGY